MYGNKSMKNSNIMTDDLGHPISDNQNSLTVGCDGPVLLQDVNLINKLASFDRERIPERNVHAKGSAAHGFFEVTHDISMYTKADFLNGIGKKTPVFARFSTVGGSVGSADTVRDPRGFAVKFYTKDGNHDMVGNNTPVFFIRDGMKFPDLIHSVKKQGGSGLVHPNTFWDFVTLSPESMHQVMILYSDRGIPYGFRHMHGFGSHTFMMVNHNNDPVWVKFHFLTNQGIKNIPANEAEIIAGKNPDFAREDLWNAINQGNFPSWNMFIQVMSLEQATQYKFDVFDVTKVWYHADFPLIPVGRLVLNRNPKNFFAETEQVAFDPGNMVPGIQASFDKMLQSRLFSYLDTHRHRLGKNSAQIPINCPFAAKVNTYFRDGPMTVNDNGGDGPNYYPNSYGGPVDNKKLVEVPIILEGYLARCRQTHPNDDYEQARELYARVMTEEKRQILIQNYVNDLKKLDKKVRERALGLFIRIHVDLAKRVGAALGYSLSDIQSITNNQQIMNPLGEEHLKKVYSF